jgi:diguanylate cyclase (GGDEF)-like protein/PAS domain S-box-containing protein
VSWLRITPRSVMVAGFAAMVVLMAQLVVVGLARLEQVSERLDAVMGEQGRRLQLTSELLEASRLRSETLAAMLAEPVARRESPGAQRLRRLGQDVALRAAALREVGHTPLERRILEEALAASAELEQLRDVIAEAFWAGDRARARALRAEREEPLGERLQEQFDSLLDYQRAAILQALGEAQDNTREAHLFVAAVGGGLLVIALLVAFSVIRYISRAEAALFREKERAEVTLHSIAEGVITTDARGRVEVLNAVAETLTGWRSRDARGLPLGAVYTVLDEENRRPLEHVFTRDAPPRFARSALLQAKDGRRIPVDESVALIRDPAGRRKGTVVVFHDVSHIRAMAQRLTWQASHDALTGLTNRREFERRLAYLLESARADGRHHALLYLDLDRFKAVNDSCGHNAGDELLRQLSAVMHVKMRGSDTLARVGGDEFGVLLEACPVDQAIRIANGLRETVRDFRFVCREREFSLGLSIGLVVVDAATVSVSEAMEAADAACYGAKKKGGGRVEIHQPGANVSRTAQGDIAMVHQISGALDKSGFRLYRQPIADVGAGAGPEHYEVLVRMVDEGGQLLPPNEFIPAAERFNLLPLVDRWVVSAVLDFMAREGPGGEGAVYSINLSGASVNDSTFTDFLRRRIDAHHVPARRLCFEITETAAISNLTKAAEFMHELKALGCRFALDDFGVGMSSFAYLKHLPADFLKIDGSFVRDLATNAVDYAIVEAINRIAHLLGMRTVAEFVADAATLARLRELQVDYAQGDAIGAPEPLLVKGPSSTAALA